VNGALKIAIGAAAVLVLAPCGLGVLAGAALDPAGASGLCAPALASGSPDAAAGGGWAAEGSWTATQVANAATIVAVGARMGVPRWGWVVAVATAMQESSLYNLGNLGRRNDHDSLGLFQQRPSQGWGTPRQIMNPVYAATKFYERLLRVPGWQSLPLTEAAQKVQRSAAPDAYQKWQPEAQHLVNVIATRLGIIQDCSAGTGDWVLPLPAGSYTLSSPFGPRWGRFHYGQDMSAPTGTPILAAAAGTVTDAGCTSPRCDIPGSPWMPGCGWRVNIDHGGGIVTRYCHAVRLAVHPRQRVTAGQVIGWVGSTGHSSGPHLHFEAHDHAPPATNANAKEPMGFLRSVGLKP